MSGKNLFSIELEYRVAPKRVLKIQADHLSRLSDGTIVARVETARGSQGMDECFIHSFHIRVPMLSYNAQLFEITHGIDIYPIQVRNDDWTFEKECNDAASFELAIADILNAPETKRRLEALRSQAFAELDVQPAMEIDNAHAPEVVDPLSPSPERDAPSLSTASELESSPQETESVPDSTDAEEEIAETELTADEDDQSDDRSTQSADELVGVVDDGYGVADTYFEEWGEPVDFNQGAVAMVPPQLGAAIIYNMEGSPLFIAYAKDIQTALKRQLSRSASPVVSKAKKSGLRFVCGTVRSIDEAEQIVESRINTMPFRGLLGDSESNDWM